jgi:hypothetical protein
MHRITNTFPLLEEQEVKELDSTLFDIHLAQSRIVWLNRSSNALQEDFALKLMNEEPQGESFDATVATILTMDESIQEKWLDLEITVAAKKIEANMAHIKKFYSRYSIAVSNRAEEKTCACTSFLMSKDGLRCTIVNCQQNWPNLGFRL